MTALLPCPFCGVDLELKGVLPTFHQHPRNGCRMDDCTIHDQSDYDAWNRRATPPSPDGYVLVPREPTDGMLDAAAEQAGYCTADWTASAACLGEHIWAAMIAAAPPTPPLSAHLDAERLVEGRGEGSSVARVQVAASTGVKSESGEGP